VSPSDKAESDRAFQLYDTGRTGLLTGTLLTRVAFDVFVVVGAGVPVLVRVCVCVCVCG
jgi:hypothetical protein